MVFKKSVAMLALAMTAALVTAEQVTVQTDLKNPVVKHVSHDHGKIHLVLAEGTKISKKPVAPKYADVKKAQDAKHKKAAEDAKHKKPAAKKEVKKVVVKKPTAVKIQPKKGEVKKHAEVKKPVAKKPEVKKHADKKHDDKKHADKKHAPKKVTEEKKEDGEVVRKYAHGEVRIAAKNQPKQEHAHKKEAKKPVAKKVEVKKPAAKKVEAKKVEAKKPVVKKPVKADEIVDDVEDADLDLEAGDKVTLEYLGHTVELELLKNGSLVLKADGEVEAILDASDVTVDFYDDGSSSDEGSDDGSYVDGETIRAPHSLVEKVEEDVSSVAKKFTELATKLTGNGAFFSKQAAPVVFIGGVIGALAAVVGIAAIAVGRARSNEAAADPQSVLAEATEDVEDVEANVTTEESSEDAAAEDSHSLDGSESESDSEVDADKEEGKFMNEGSV